ncbi:MAG TPA: LD-carboxypeptidase [Chitinophagales bacterium]|nr:LD-carboxypeptidase [Chitinophagales bacterium]
MYIPANLKPGDTIGIVCTARKIDLESIQFAIRFFENAGFKVLIGDTIGAEYFQYAGDDSFRRKDLQKMLDNPKVKAIISGRGGYGTVRIIDDIYYGNYLEQPKWIIGYSDITALHSHLNHVMGIGTLHATMPINFTKNTDSSLQSLLDALTGKPLRYTVDPHPLNRLGSTSGEIIGGNLSILYSLLGTKTLLHTANKILFLEDLDEYLYHIDRMMIALKRAGKLNQLAGIIVGGMSDMNDNTIPYGKSAEEIILEHVQEYDYPVCFGFPAGHIDDNRALKLGAIAQLNITERGVEFSQ